MFIIRRQSAVASALKKGAAYRGQLAKPGVAVEKVPEGNAVFLAERCVSGGFFLSYG
jgi:hypothetical protein